MLRPVRSGAMLGAMAMSGCRRFMSSCKIILPSVHDSAIASQTPSPPAAVAAARPLLPLPITDEEVAILEERLCCIISNRNRHLIQEALIHTSYPNRPRSALTDPPTKQSYKLLTQIGQRCHSFRLRSPEAANLLPLNLSPHKLARTALRLGLYDFLRRDSPKLDQTVEQFVKEQEGQVLYRGIPPKVPKVLTDIVYAIMGVFLVDFKCDIHSAFKMIEVNLHPIIFWSDVKHSVKTLHRICKDHSLTLEFKNKTSVYAYTTRVFINNNPHGYGSSIVKADAEGLAALDALNKLPKYMLPKKMLAILYSLGNYSRPFLELDDSHANSQIVSS